MHGIQIVLKPVQEMSSSSSSGTSPRFFCIFMSDGSVVSNLSIKVLTKKNNNFFPPCLFPPPLSYFPFFCDVVDRSKGRLKETLPVVASLFRREASTQMVVLGSGVNIALP